MKNIILNPESSLLKGIPFIVGFHPGILETFSQVAIRNSHPGLFSVSFGIQFPQIQIVYFHTFSGIKLIYIILPYVIKVTTFLIFYHLNS